MPNNLTIPSLDYYNTMFHLQQADKLIFVNIKESYNAFLNNDVNNEYYRPSLYDCTVKFWMIAMKKAETATHICGCYKGKVVEVVRITGVSTEIGGKYDGRRIFEGIEQPESPYIGFDLHELFDTLSNFRMKYWNL